MLGLLINLTLTNQRYCNKIYSLKRQTVCDKKGASERKPPEDFSSDNPVSACKFIRYISNNRIS